MFSSIVFLKLALGGYALGTVLSLLTMRREKLANFFGFGTALLAAGCGIWGALLYLIAPPIGGGPAFQLWPSLIPYVKLTVQLDPLGAFFLLIVSLLAGALSLYSFGYV